MSKPKQKRRTPRQTRSQATVDIILEAAARVLSDEGPAGATTNRIAERAGVSVGSVYQYFDSKQALYKALGERYASGLRATVIDVAPMLASAPPGEVVPVLLDTILGRIAADPVLNGMLHLTAVPPRDFAALAAFERELEQLTTTVLTHHPRLRALCEDPSLTARILVRGTAGVVARTLATEPALITTPRFRDELFRLVNGYFGGALTDLPAEPTST